MTSARVLMVAAGMVGAAGVALSATAAHRSALTNLGVAANMLMFHAPALLTLSYVGGNKLRKIAGFVLLTGLALFAGDLLARSLFDVRLFPMAAPTGGLLLIAGWLGVAASALMDKKT